MRCRARERLAGNGDASGDVGWRRGVGLVGLSLAENTLERGAGEPYQVTACVHVEGYGLGLVAQIEGESVVAAR